MTGADRPEIRDAASVIVLRRDPAPAVLMGQRGAAAAFMPSKFVFPGGAVDPADATVALAGLPENRCLARLQEDAAPDLARALVAAAIRELWEETGLVLGTPAPWMRAPADWTGFAATGHRPSGEGLRFVFRAITPPGRPRRFDARFFLVDADRLRGDPEDFSRASDELAALQWVPLAEARRFDLPFITEVVLAEIAAHAEDRVADGPVPFFRNDDEESLFLRLHGRAPGTAD